jgi:beta-galactosidase
VQVRTDGDSDFVFIMNFAPHAQTVMLDDRRYIDMIADAPAFGALELPPYGIRILRRG